ncbi:MAG: MFS transporter [Candidatus Hodarchaeales archaeon]
MPDYRDPRIYFIFSTTLFAVIGVSLIAPALPTMKDELGLDKAQIGLMITFFTVPGIFLAPIAGISIDKYGRKEVLVPSLILFGLAGSACALTNQFEVLLLLRALQGVGGAALMALSTTLIGDFFVGSDRVDVLGKNASVLSVGTASYPLIGGFLTVLIGWHAPFVLFFLAVPLGLLIWKFLDLPNEKEDLQDFRKYFRGAMSDLWNREALMALLVGISGFILLYGGLMAYSGVFLKDEFDADADVIGLLLALSSISTAIIASRINWISAHVSPTKVFLSALFLQGLALGLISILPQIEYFVIVSLLFGTGMGLLVPTLQAEIVRQAPQERRGIVMSLLSSVTRIGQSIGPLLFGLLLTQFSLSQVFLIISGSTIFGILFFLFLNSILSQKHRSENAYQYLAED